MNTDAIRAKKALRSELLSRLAGLDPVEKQAFDKNILQRLQDLPYLQSANHIFSYVSLPHEADTHQLIDWLEMQGKQVSIPKIIDDRMLPVRFSGWKSLKVGKLGILEPQTLERIDSPIEVCITPGTGFSITGNRLGLGKGNYDRWFFDYPKVVKIAPAYELQIVDNIPVDSHDIPVDIIVTEKRHFRP